MCDCDPAPLRDFRSYEAADVRLGPGLTVISGRNGAGKTNLLEALYFACTGRSCRTANEREVVRFGAELTRLELPARTGSAAHEVSVGFKPGEPKRLQRRRRACGETSSARAAARVGIPARSPGAGVGAPALRRSHLDQVVAALWPARAGLVARTAAALAQRNALLASIRAGRASGPRCPRGMPSSPATASR